jgi:hypothetical protein
MDLGGRFDLQMFASTDVNKMFGTQEETTDTRNRMIALGIPKYKK